MPIYNLNGSSTPTPSGKYNLSGSATPESSGGLLASLFNKGKKGVSSALNFTKDIFTGADNTGGGMTREFVQELPRATGGVVRDLAQGFVRSIGSVGLSLQNATLNKIPYIGSGYQESIPAPRPDDNSAGAKFQRFFTGQEDTKDLAFQVSQYEQIIKQSPTAQKLGLDKGALPIAFGGVIGSSVLDLYPGSAAESKVIKELAKEATEEGSLQILKKLGFTDQLAKDFAPQFADATTAAEVKDILHSAKAVQGSEVFAKYLGDDVPEQVVKKEISSELAPLADEARKYETPSEFGTALRAQLDEAKAKDLTFTGAKGEDLALKTQNIKKSFDEKFGNGAFDLAAKTDDLTGAGKQEIDEFFNRAKDTEYPIDISIDRQAIEQGMKAQEKQIAREKTQALKRYGENTSEIRNDIETVENGIKNLKEYVNNNPAKDLFNKIRRFTKVVYDAKKPYLDVGLDELSARAVRDPNANKFLKRLDTAISEYGYTDLDHATRGIEDWLAARGKVKGMQEDRAAMVREFQEMRMKTTDKLSLEKFLNESGRETDKLIDKRDAGKRSTQRVETSKAIEKKALDSEEKGFTAEITKANGGVTPPTTRGDLTPPELNFTEWKDKGALSLNRETMERNLERIAGKDAPAVKQFLVEPVRKNETDRIRFTNDLRKETKEKIVKKLGIRSGSKEDALVQKYGEGILTPEELAKIGKKTDMKKIQEASRYFKSKYDDLLDRVNVVREKFGYTPIPRRDDYFRHFQEIDDSIRSFGLIFREQDLPTELAGITGVFSPGKPFSTAEMQRKGLKTTYSAIKGFDNYLDTISKQIYHIESVQRGRGLEKYIRNSSKAINKAMGKTEGEIAQIKLPNFVSNLHDYTNIVAGKKSALDRAFESMVGRPIYGITNWLGRKTGANMIGGNLSSAITNFAPLAQSLATTRKMQAIRGLGEGLLSPFKDSDLIDGMSSSFLTRRWPSKHTDLTGLKKGVEFASGLFEAVDKFTARSIVAGKYHDILARGASKESAMKAADDYAGRIMSDRSIANSPNLFNSQSLRFITQFQTEVNNIYSFLKHDIPHMADGDKRKIASSIGQFVIYSYLFNSAYQEVTGRRPILDPIYMGLELMGMTPETEKTSAFSRIGAAGGDLAGNLPFVGGITGGRFPISAGIPNIKDIFNGDSTLTKELLKPAYLLIPPTGGLQLKKTIEGLKAYDDGKVKTPSGKTTRYKIEQSPENLLRAALFGKSSTPEAREYYQKVQQKKGQEKKKSNKYAL